MGAAAAFIMPSTLSILVNVFPPDERTKAIAIWAATTGAAGAIGPVASGWLLGHFWFGSVFLVNVPIIAARARARLLPRAQVEGSRAGAPRSGRRGAVDRRDLDARVRADRGARATAGRSPTTLGAFAIAVVVLALFVAWELHVDEPMLDMHYFRNPAFSTGTGGMILVFMAMFGVMFLITQYFQLVLGYSPLGAALRLLPMAPIMIIVAPLTPRLSAAVRRQPRRRPPGCADRDRRPALVQLARPAHRRTCSVLGDMCLLVTGIALTMSPMTAAIMSAVPPRRAGAGSAMNDATPRARRRRSASRCSAASPPPATTTP